MIDTKPKTKKISDPHCHTVEPDYSSSVKRSVWGPWCVFHRLEEKTVGKLFLAVPPQGKVALPLLLTYICLFLAMTMTIAERVEH